jgi:Cdc6-like AAA superfamily ATPase
MQPKLWSPLSDDYKPPLLLFRAEQLNAMFKLATHPVPSNIYIQGDHGLGKTLTTRFFRDEIEASGAGKCYHIEVKHKIVDTLKDMKSRCGFEVPDYMLSPSSLTEEILRESEKEDLICLIIDEPQKAHSMQDINHMIFDFYQDFFEKRKLSIIIVSQMIFSILPQHLLPDTLSRLQLKPILFPNYDVPEIVEILKQRLHYMLDESQYELDGLVALASHIRRIGSDIREALDILRFAVEEADACITKGVVHKAVEWGKQRWWKSELESLPPHWAYILFLTALSCLKYKAATQPRVMYQYHTNAKHLDVDPIGRRTIYYAFNKLAEKGYFTQRQEGFGRSRTTHLLMDESDRDHIIQAGKEFDWSMLLLSSEALKEGKQTKLN